MAPFSGIAILLAVAATLAVSAVQVTRAQAEDATPPLRPPAVPLAACDPYFSVWSCADKLTDDCTRHWTRRKQALTGLIRIDGKAYRFLGDEPKDVPALPQTGVKVLPTRTVCDFELPELKLTLTFTTPALSDDLDVLSRPLTYLTWEARAGDGREHAVSVYFSASGELAVNEPDQKVVWSREKLDALVALKLGSVDQPVLQKKGDDLRIDWGYAYAATPAQGASGALGSHASCVQAFVAGGTLPAADDGRMPREVKEDLPVMALALDLGRVGAAPVSRYAMLAYDDEYSINYMGRKLRPYWRRGGWEAADLLQAAAREYTGLQKRCQTFDDELMADLTRIGGLRYARICALAYRQCLAANKVAADANGRPLLFPKENFSNGCIATVDVIYPMDPQFLLLSPTLTKASLQPILDYAASERWKFPFAPHDLGTYPKATGQVYGGGERTEENQMPVEETGNMLLLLAALAKIEGKADYAAKYWPLLGKWAEYLKSKGLDPENQLCTDDFAGHLAHNVNLSAKAILALAAYAMLCEMKGEQAPAAAYRNLAREYAGKWVQMADDGDHYRLAFDRKGTWSQKYNLVWDSILGLKLFAPEVVQKEIAFYKKTQKRFGLPLDNRQPYTKLDWTIWTATLAPARADFEALVAPVYDFLNHTPQRVPMTDWYFTPDARHTGFQARSVVGGVFIKMLTDAEAWKKWAGRDKTPAGNWAPLPTPPQVKEIVPTAQRQGVAWLYTFEKPDDDWYKADFKADGWKQGTAGFGSAGTPGIVVRTSWKSSNIWMRREFVMPEGAFPGLQLWAYHDEDVEVYLNGVLAGRAAGYATEYEGVEISAAAKEALKPGKNVMAVHCHQTQGGQGVDVGMVEIQEKR
jgi:hypothetical protein